MRSSLSAKSAAINDVGSQPEQRNLAVVLHGVDDLRLDDVTSVPTPGPNQVRIAIKKVGICMSDVHYWVKGKIGAYELKAPMVMGHESAGVIDAVGEGVTKLQVGDRVAIEPGVPDKQCDYCLSGMYNLCPNMQFCATPPVDGSMATYYVHDADFCHKLPDSVSFEEGALMEPLSVGIHAAHQADIQVGDRVVINGTGPMGIVSMMACKAAGAHSVVMTAHTQSKLDRAKSLGADHVVNVSGMDPKEAAQAALAALHGVPAGEAPWAQAVIECSGSQSGIASAIHACQSGRNLVLVGLGKPELTVPLLEAESREVTIKGVFRYRNTYPKAIALVESGKIDVQRFISHRYSIFDAKEAYQKLRDNDPNVSKIVIDCSVH